jgi:hypothetical protein
MRIYLTHCSAEKDAQLQDTGVTVTPDRLYTNPQVQRFMERCKEKNVQWAILSDRYGVYQSNDCNAWYEKHPDTVTPQEENAIIQDFNRKLDLYNEIHFLVRADSFHPFYARVLKKTILAERIQSFQDINSIE